MQYKIGQEVWFKLNHRRNARPFPVAITKVGRKWVECGRHGRFDQTSGGIDGKDYGIVGKAYPSLEAYDAEQRLAETWKTVFDAVDRQGPSQPPKDLTIKQLEEIAHLLGVEIPES